MKKALRVLLIALAITLLVSNFAFAEDCLGANEGRTCGNLGFNLAATGFTYELINWDKAWESTQEIWDVIESQLEDDAEADISPFSIVDTELYIDSSLEDYQILCLINQSVTAYVNHLQSCYSQHADEQQPDVEGDCPDDHLDRSSLSFTDLGPENSYIFGYFSEDEFTFDLHIQWHWTYWLVDYPIDYWRNDIYWFQFNEMANEAYGPVIIEVWCEGELLDHYQVMGTGTIPHSG